MLWLGGGDGGGDGGTDGGTDGLWLGATLSVGVGDADGWVVDWMVSVGVGATDGTIGDGPRGADVRVGTGRSRRTGASGVGAAVAVGRGVVCAAGNPTLTSRGAGLSAGVAAGVSLGATVGVGSGDGGGPDGDAITRFVSGPGMTSGFGAGVVGRSSASKRARAASSASNAAARRDHGNATGWLTRGVSRSVVRPPGAACW